MLAIPENGLQLESSAKSSNFLPLQAFGLSLDDSVIEDMIKCVQNGDQIELALGNNPVSPHISNAPFQPDYYTYYTISKPYTIYLVWLNKGSWYTVEPDQAFIYMCWIGLSWD